MMGLGGLAHRALVNVEIKTTNEAGTILSDDVYTITDGLIPSWGAAHYRGAMNLPGAWRASLIAADLLGSLPWVAHERGPDGVEIPAPLQPGILTQMSPPDHMVTTLSSFGLDYIWHGNAVAVKGDVLPGGDVEVAVPVPIGNVAIGRSTGRDGTGLRRGQLGYRIGNTVYTADEVIHIKGPCEPGALRGMSALECHLTGAIGAGLELNRQAGNLSVAGVPSGVLKVTAPDLSPGEAARLKARWLASQRDRTVAILNDVTDFTPLAWNPTEAQLLEARRFSLHEIALIVGVPLYFLGVETSNRTYSNVEQEGIVLTKFHMNGAITRFEAALTECVQPGQRVLADLSAVLRADTLTRYQAWQVGVTAGFITPNEARAKENLPPVDGGDALRPTTPQAGQPGGPGTGEDVNPLEIGEGDGTGTQGRRKATDPAGAHLKEYWTTGPGRAKWSTWTELYEHLVKHLPPDRAKRTAAQWFHDVMGFWPGDAKNKRHATNGAPFAHDLVGAGLGGGGE